MVMLKAQKVEFVKKLSEDMKRHKTVAVVPLEMVPARLMQKVRNGLKPDAMYTPSCNMQSMRENKYTSYIRKQIKTFLMRMLSNHLYIRVKL